MTDPLIQAIERSRADIKSIKIRLAVGDANENVISAIERLVKLREATAIMAEALERIQNYDLEHNDPLVDCALRQWSKEALAKANALFEETDQND